MNLNPYIFYLKSQSLLVIKHSVQREIQMKKLYISNIYVYSASKEKLCNQGNTQLSYKMQIISHSIHHSDKHLTKQIDFLASNV